MRLSWRVGAGRLWRVGEGFVYMLSAGPSLRMYRGWVRSWVGRAGTVGSTAVASSESDRNGWSGHSGQGLALVDHHQVAIEALVDFDVGASVAGSVVVR